MPLNIPVQFDQLALQPKNVKGTPPVVIRASDLMKNFTYCALDVDDSFLQNTTESGGYAGRKLRGQGMFLQFVYNNQPYQGFFLVQGGVASPTPAPPPP